MDDIHYTPGYCPGRVPGDTESDHAWSAACRLNAGGCGQVRPERLDIDGRLQACVDVRYSPSIRMAHVIPIAPGGKPNAPLLVALPHEVLGALVAARASTSTVPLVLERVPGASHWTVLTYGFPARTPTRAKPRESAPGAVVHPEPLIDATLDAHLLTLEDGATQVLRVRTPDDRTFLVEAPPLCTEALLAGRVRLELLPPPKGARFAVGSWQHLPSRVPETDLADVDLPQLSRIATPTIDRRVQAFDAELKGFEYQDGGPLSVIFTTETTETVVVDAPLGFLAFLADHARARFTVTVRTYRDARGSLVDELVTWNVRVERPAASEAA